MLRASAGKLSERGTDAKSSRAGLSTREKLLAATEQLVAEEGIDSASTRQIAAAAGVDVGAIHHHFGSKDNLILSVREWRLGTVAQTLEAVIAERLAQPSPLTVIDMARFMVLTFVLLADPRSEARNYPGFVHSLRVNARFGPKLGLDTEWSKRLLKIYSELRPDLSSDERRQRLAIATQMVMGTMGNQALRGWLLNTSPDAAEHLEDTLLGCVAGALDYPGGLSLGR